MAPFSQLTPVAAFARASQIQDTTPDTGEIRGKEGTCFSDSVRLHVNTRGRATDDGFDVQRASRAAHRELGLDQGGRALYESIRKRNPTCDLAVRGEASFVKSFKDAYRKDVGPALTVGRVRTLMAKETTGYEGVTTLGSLFESKAAPAQLPPSPPEPVTPALDQDDPKVRIHSGPAPRESDFTTQQRQVKPAAVSAQPAVTLTPAQAAVAAIKARYPALAKIDKLSQVVELLVARVATERPDLRLDQLADHPVFRALTRAGADDRSAKDIANYFFNVNFVQVKR